MGFQAEVATGARLTLGELGGRPVPAFSPKGPVLGQVSGTPGGQQGWCPRSWRDGTRVCATQIYGKASPRERLRLSPGRKLQKEQPNNSERMKGDLSKFVLLLPATPWPFPPSGFQGAIFQIFQAPSDLLHLQSLGLEDGGEEKWPSCPLAPAPGEAHAGRPHRSVSSVIDVEGPGRVWGGGREARVPGSESSSDPGSWSP